MIKVLLEYFTNIDEVEDFFQLLPTICNYFEIDLGWNMAISFLISLIVTLGIVAIPILITSIIITTIARVFKNL